MSLEKVAEVRIAEPIDQKARRRISRRLSRLKKKYAHAYEIKYLWSESGDRVGFTVKGLGSGAIVFSARKCRVYVDVPVYVKPLLSAYSESLERELAAFFRAKGTGRSR